jgi:hypothetical protein
MLVDAAEGGKERVLPLALPKIFRVAEPSPGGAFHHFDLGQPVHMRSHRVPHSFLQSEMSGLAIYLCWRADDHLSLFNHSSTTHSKSANVWGTRHQ